MIGHFAVCARGGKGERPQRPVSELGRAMVCHSRPVGRKRGKIRPRGSVVVVVSSDTARTRDWGAHYGAETLR